VLDADDSRPQKLLLRIEQHALFGEERLPDSPYSIDFIGGLWVVGHREVDSLMSKWRKLERQDPVNRQ
jgi:hypothetical protein